MKQWGALVLGGLILTAALYFTLFKSQRDQNLQAQQQLETKLHENAELEAYRPKLAEMERQLASLKQQLEIERRIVPDEKQADDFIRAMMAEASKAGVEVRRFTARAVSSKDFYSELPFELEVDGPYYSMLNFFDRVGKLERVVNVSKNKASTFSARRLVICSAKQAVRLIPRWSAWSAVIASGPTLPPTQTFLVRAACRASRAAAPFIGSTCCSRRNRARRTALAPNVLVRIILAPAEMYSSWMVRTRWGWLTQISSRQWSAGTSRPSNSVPIAPSPHTRRSSISCNKSSISPAR